MSKLVKVELAECNHPTELKGIYLGCKENKHNKLVFSDFKTKDPDRGYKNLIIGKPGLGKDSYVKN
ncbi:MAG: hypothetical protein FH756_00135 [Firmicutes bacterium]|nr:hypothetical protein [Bacillota bacterium]